MKVELNATWPLYGQFYDLSRGKSGAAPYVINLAPFLRKEPVPSDNPAAPDFVVKSLEELQKNPPPLGDITELRGIMLHKTIILTQTKGARSTLIEFLLFLLNHGIYPLMDPAKGPEVSLIGACYGLGLVSHKGTVMSIKDYFMKELPTVNYPGVSKAEMEVLQSRESALIVPLFLRTYKLSV